MPGTGYLTAFVYLCHLPKSAETQVMPLVTLQLTGHHVNLAGTRRETCLSLLLHNVLCLSCYAYLLKSGWKVGCLLDTIPCREQTPPRGSTSLEKHTIFGPSRRIVLIHSNQLADRLWMEGGVPIRCSTFLGLVQHVISPQGSSSSGTRGQKQFMAARR